MGVEVGGGEGKEGDGERGEDQEVERVGEDGTEDFKAGFCCPRQALPELQVYEPNKCRRCFKPSSFGVVIMWQWMTATVRLRFLKQALRWPSVHQ